MSGMLESLIRKLEEHALRWIGLEEISVPSAAADDAGIEHQNDLQYMNELADDIERNYLHLMLRISDAPTAEDVGRAMYLRQSAEMWPERSFTFDWPGSDVEAALAGAGELLRQWRIELDDEDVAA